MSRIEDELKQALRREEPSKDFTELVMRRVAAAPANMKQEKLRGNYGWWRILAGFFQPVQIKWAMAAGIVCLLMFAVFGAYRYREHRRATAEITEGEKAKEQVMLAIKIASTKLNVAQKKVQENAEK